MADPARTVLVTGGAGFIGSHVCKRLHQLGYQPVVYDNLSTGHKSAVRFGPFHQGDVRDVGRLTEVLRVSNARAVMHFAASAYVGESIANPAKYYANNVVGMIGLLDAVCSQGLEHIIFSSSCATYGMPDADRICEATPQRPINPYGQTKLIGEQMLRDYSAAFGFRYTCLRYFNACGADRDGELVEDHQPETHLIPRMLMAAEGFIERLEVFGDDYPTPDGTCIRDFIHVEDLAQGHVLALDRQLAGGDSDVFNLGGGYGYSIRELIEACERLTGKPLAYSILPRRVGDPPRLVASTTKAKERLGFEARLSDLPTMLGSALTSVREVYGKQAPITFNRRG